MLLIDALYIREGGGVILLHYLLDSLMEKNVMFHLIYDSRCKDDFIGVASKTMINVSLKSRYNYYRKHRFDFSSVLCFANIPAPLKLQVPVYTYFHNINLLTLEHTRSSKEFFISWLKRQVFRLLKGNTDFWVVQTSNTQNELIHNLNENVERVLILPFFFLPKNLIDISLENERKDYLFVGNYYNGAKGHDELLDSWEILFNRGYNLRLHLTIDKSNEKVCKRIEEMNERGINVVNHGTIPFDKVVDLYAKSKALVYPSHNESLGLGIVEAITAGCDVLASDLPFTHSICVPSRVFNPYSPDSIADAIIKYEEGEYSKSELIVRNQIDELIGLLVKNEKNINS